MSRVIFALLLVASLLLGSDITLRIVEAMETASTQECTAPDDSEDDYPDEWLAPVEASFPHRTEVAL